MVLLRVLVVAIYCPLKFTVPPGFRVILAICSTAEVLEAVSADPSPLVALLVLFPMTFAPPLIVVEPTTSVCVPPVNCSVAEPSVRTAEEDSLVPLLVE